MFFAGLGLIAIGLSLGVFLISLGTFLFAIAWALDAILSGFSFKYKFKRFLSNKALVLLSAIFLVHVIGLAYTSNLDYALADLRIKLPIFVLPILFAGAPNLKQSGADALAKIFLIALCLSTFLSYYKIVSENLVDLRNAMIYVSHIRMGLMICLAIFLIIFSWQNQNRNWKIGFSLIFIWLLFFMYVAQLSTGIIVLILSVILVALIWAIANWKRGISRLILLSAITLGTLVYINSMYMHAKYFKPKQELVELDTYSSSGEKYRHDTSKTYLENGYYTEIYVAKNEWEEAWNDRSQLRFTDTDQRGQVVESSLKRYMTSKGLRKDKEGVMALTDDDVENIESGVTNVEQPKWGPLKQKYNDIFFEWTAYQNGANPSGNTLLMRLEYWKASFNVFKDNMLIGVGTGDIKDELDKHYEESKRLDKNYWFRTHNQLLSFAATFGVIGLVVILLCMYYPLTKFYNNYAYIAFVLIYSISFITEDTLETQVGATFFAYFNSLFIVNWMKN